MKTDSLFYQIFRILPGTLFELLGQGADTAQAYQFASIEIKQPNFRIDGVFKPAVDSADNLIYFVEVQFQRDEHLYARLFAEIFLYLEQENPASNWQAVVIFAGPNID
ncbi:MAG: Rpn family recombination-promoting nuclease/putative transposase, partial [Armatimonadota bacterium]|nr:Rpn family recombination-promoting nuclease/putative transposase [Armatimonadota bacterium]